MNLSGVDGKGFWYWFDPLIVSSLVLSYPSGYILAVTYVVIPDAAANVFCLDLFNILLPISPESA